MYNYSKNNVSINADIMAIINQFNETARQLATESVEHTTAKHEINDKIDEILDIENKTDDDITKLEELKKSLDDLEAEWKARQSELNLTLYGGKVDGKKTDGICSIVTDDLYKSYVAMIQDGKTGKYREQIREFILAIINGDDLKQGAENHLYNDILTTMSSVRYNSNSQIAQGAAFITTINKRTYKKMLLGAICDIVANNKTLKVKKAKTENK